MNDVSAAPRVLMLEDDDSDHALVRRALAKTSLAGAEIRWARSREEFIRALDEFSPHLVLSDYKLPTIDGLAALALVRERSTETPFILISGTIGEEKAVEALKAGATDYVLKERLERLGIVLDRALRERRDRQERLKTEAALQESQARLLQSQKMEAMGRLSGGVAHDFNNILTAITGYTELALANPSLQPDLRADLKEILAAAFRAAALTRQLLAFSRRQIFSPKVIDLNQSLAELDRMLQRIIGEDVVLRVAPARGLLRVRADADQIGQVIMNLVVNARDAMPNGGELFLRTANVELGERDLAGHPDAAPGPWVRLSVEDNGVGMDEAVRARIFEPFFTTKSKDKGTGLGLATVYGIVKQSGGFISVVSAPGRGTTFMIHLPAVEAAPDAARPAPAGGAVTGSETVLIVDDDASVGLIARRMLESHGYRVVEARGGEQALKLCAEGLAPRLLLSDVVMAGMTGPELARRLRQTQTDCRVLFVSGYADAGIPELSTPSWDFLPKPFAAEALVKKVRKLLDSSAA